MRENNNPFALCPDSLSSRAKLKAVLADFFPGERLKTNVILAAFDEGIVETLEDAEELDNILAGQIVKALVADYGISKENARFAITYWFEQYGEEVLGKVSYLDFDEEGTETSGDELEYAIESEDDTASRVYRYHSGGATPTTEVISVAAMEEHEKIPKSFIQRNVASEQKYGITNFRCAVFKDYEWDRYWNFKVTGEYSGKVSRYLLIVIKVYNANNEMMDAAFDYKISSDFSGKQSFQTTLQIPNDEYISKIDTRIIPDPTFD
mgnify:CR=1 FL=1